MKKIICYSNQVLSIFLLIVGIVLTSCTEDMAPITVSSVTLDTTSMTLTEGDSQTITATISPSDAENKTILWISSNSSVASVRGGVVTAIAPGTATITAKTEDGAKTATCKVTVVAKVYPVTSVSLDKTSASLTEGETITLTATVNPDNATNKNVSWKSSNTSVASVVDGKVTAVKAGTTTITVTTEDGNKTATCDITVNAKVYPVTSVSLNKTSASLTEGETITLTATVNPDNATNKNVSWKSSNTSVASVVDGKVTAVKAGTTTITVTTEDGNKTATCDITVNAKVYPVTSVSLNKTSASLTEGETITLTATVNPDNATNKNVSWKSSNTSVASVVDGKVTAVKAGTTTITVTTEDGNKTATCDITVNAKVYPVTSVSLNKTSAEVVVGNKLTLVATVKPSNAQNKNVSWKSSNTSVATVSSTGEVLALAKGTAYIIVTTEDGKYTAQCKVSVVSKVVNGGNEDTSDENWGI